MDLAHFQTLIVSDREVGELLAMAECIEVMDLALRTLAVGDALLPLRQVVSLPGTRNLFALMPGQIGSGPGAASGPAALGAKVITVFPGNEATPLDSHLGVVLLFDAGSGRLLAILDASSVTAIRTAAVSGVATRTLANPDAGDLALLGSGAQAMTHLEAMGAVRPLRRVRVWSRSPDRCARFALAAHRKLGVTVEPMPDVESCVHGADLICTVTASREPVLEGRWIADGAHVNAVGAALPTARELDTEAIRRARLFVDRRESAMAEAGDVLIPLAEGAITGDHLLGEVGDVLLGAIPGRVARPDVTVFKSLGLAIEDLAAARYVHEKAVAQNVGTWIALGGLRHEA